MKLNNMARTKFLYINRKKRGYLYVPQKFNWSRFWDITLWTTTLVIGIGCTVFVLWMLSQWCAQNPDFNR